MIRILLVGAPVMILCLLLQATFVAVCLRRYACFKVPPKYARSPINNVGVSTAVMTATVNYVVRQSRALQGKGAGNA